MSSYVLDQTRNINISNIFENVALNLADKLGLSDAVTEYKKQQRITAHYENADLQRKLMYHMLEKGTLEKSAIIESMDSWNLSKAEKKEIKSILDNLTEAEKNVYQTALTAFENGEEKKDIKRAFTVSMYRLSDMFLEDQQKTMDHTIKNADLYYDLKTRLHERNEADRLKVFSWYVNNNDLGYGITPELLERRYKETMQRPEHALEVAFEA